MGEDLISKLKGGLCLFHSIRSGFPRLIDYSLRFNSIKRYAAIRSVIPAVTDQRSERSDAFVI